VRTGAGSTRPFSDRAPTSSRRRTTPSSSARHPAGRPGDPYHSGSRPFSERESRIARALILRVRSDVSIWYHQALRLVDPSTAAATVERRYASLVGLPLREIGPLPGVATRWSNRALPGTTSFVVELAAGPLTARQARRHAVAVLRVAADLTSS